MAAELTSPWEEDHVYAHQSYFRELDPKLSLFFQIMQLAADF